MAVAQGKCPSCGAPITFSVGSSIAKICEYCRATVYRTDRGLEDLGKFAALANTQSLIAIGDQGRLAGRPFEVLGRVQLDHGLGPWDEYYVALDHGQTWGWLAYAHGMWFATTEVLPTPPAPRHGSLVLEADVSLGPVGTFRVTEVKTASISSAEGELPDRYPPGFVRHYADLEGARHGFCTLDYGDGRAPLRVYVGKWLAESELEVVQMGPRTAAKVATSQIRCPACGGDVPKLSGDRAERLGCPYCGAVSDIAAQRVVAAQDAALASPEIPIGSRGVLDGITYVCIAYVRRSSDFDGEVFSWEEYLLFSEGLGFRWLVKDETTWMWVMPLGVAELDLRSMPREVIWRGRPFRRRNANPARVEYVLGEVYWKCQVGETVQAMDFIAGGEVLSRESTADEVRWSYSAPLPWPLIANAFGLDPSGPGGRFAAQSSATAATVPAGCGCASMMLVLFLLVVFASLVEGGGRGGAVVVPVVGGSGFYRGGK
jgi:hypothetical protein